MKSIFITGGTSGIGLELARLFLNQGCRVGVCGRNLSKLPDELSSPWVNKLEQFEVSVTDKEALQGAITEFSVKGLDILIANAGISHGHKTPLPDFPSTEKIIETNILGVIYAFEAALKKFEAQGSGHLVGIASVAGFIGLPGAAAYSASKGAIINLMESYALDLGKFNISATCICPGFIDTPLTKKNDHSMPFLMSVEKGADLIKKAIDKKKALYVFPWQMALVIHILRRLPRFIYRRLMKLPVADYSPKEVQGERK